MPSQVNEQQSARRVEVRRVLDAPIEEVYAAWTDAEGMAEWMRPGPAMDARCELDVRVGGSFRIRMLGPDGAVFDHHGEYRVVEPPHRLAFTWRLAGGGDGETLVTVALSEVGGRTELVLTHEGLGSAVSAENHAQGWTRILELLAERVESR